MFPSLGQDYEEEAIPGVESRTSLIMEFKKEPYKINFTNIFATSEGQYDIFVYHKFLPKTSTNKQVIQENPFTELDFAFNFDAELEVRVKPD